MIDHQYNCRVCGLKLEEPPWGQDGETPLFEICPCCGVEFGYEDSTPLSAKRYREEWLSKGGVWFRPQDKPEGWNFADQLNNRPPGFSD